MSQSGSAVCDATCACGACQGIQDETPVELGNRPGLSAIRYRVGDHGRFKASLLAGVSRAAWPALQGLTTRQADDFSIALLDAFGVMADVLTFYQERIANESYLRTATERLSVGHIARLIGYELRPGSASRASLAFTMQEGPGAVDKLTLPVGTRVQSTPGPDEEPQVFETIEEIEVRPDWNAMPARSLVEQTLADDLAFVTVKGGAVNVRPGDGILLVFQTSGNSEFTAAFRRVHSVEVDPLGQWTRLSLEAGSITANFDGPSVDQTGIFVFRAHASLFGYNAPDFTTYNNSLKNPNQNATDWEFDPSEKKLTLDAVHREIVPGGWAIRELPDSPALILRVTAVRETGRAAFALAGKVTQIDIEPGKDSVSAEPKFPDLRSVTVHAVSEKLEPAAIPQALPVWGDTIVLGQAAEGLEPGRRVAVSGRRLRAEVLEPVEVVPFWTTQMSPKTLQPGDQVNLLAPPTPGLGGRSTFFEFISEDALGVIEASPDQVRFLEDSSCTELVTLSGVSDQGKRLTFSPPLTYTYDPPTVMVNANVAEATHGETVRETFEGGDATRVFQRFALKQTPLTYVAATTPSGVCSTLRVWVDEVEWHEVPSLYGRGPKDRVFVTRQDGEGRTWIQFGDGVNAARLPTGQRNVRAEYRRGIGAAGILKAGQINLLLTRPAGLKEAMNPLPSADGKDPEVLEDARQNAPLTVLTLDRVVSLQDYEDFARAFAGIYKAQATWTWFHRTRGVFLTVAGFKGGAVSLEGRQKHRAALAEWGDPFVPIAVENHEAVTFRTGLRVKIAPDRETANVLKAVDKALRTAFSFECRSFGQAVTLAEVTAAAQAVAGVVAVQVAKLYRSGDPDPEAGLSAPLASRAPQPGERGEVLPAELLTLDPAPLDLLEELS